MKGILLILVVPLLLCWSGSVHAQQNSLSGINYQAIARNASGSVLALTAIQVKFSILDGHEGGPATYIEVHNPTTTPQGLFTLVIGKGTPQLGTFSNIPWANGNQFLKVEIDINGSGNFLDFGVTPFMSVPYALFAANGGSGGGTGGSVAITWLGTLAAPPATALENQAYYNSVDRRAYIYDNTGAWQVLAQDGNSVYWLGSFAADPASPGVNQAYYNTTDKKAYIYDGTAWQVMVQDGIQGVGISWQGTFAAAPAAPELNYAYYNTTDRASYIYDGTAWTVLAEGGSGFTITRLDYRKSGRVELETSVGNNLLSTNRAWMVGGNDSTDASADFLGTMDANPVIFKTSGNGTINERARITPYTTSASQPFPVMIINGSTDTTQTQGMGVLSVFGAGAPLATNGAANIPQNGVNAYAGGAGAGVFGRNYSTGVGVRGVGNTNAGVMGYVRVKEGVGVKGDNGATDGGFGVVGRSNAPVYASSGSNNATLSSGVLGVSNNANGLGVLGIGNNGALNLEYVTKKFFTPNGAGGTPGGAGVQGVGEHYGVIGMGVSNTAASGLFNGNGVVGIGVGLGTLNRPMTPTGGSGVSGISSNIGVAGYATSSAAASTLAAAEEERWGGYFEYNNGTTTTKFATAFLAGKRGGLNIAMAGTGSKSTIVKDDEGKDRLLFCTEAPEILFQDFGQGQLKDGAAHIDLERLLVKSIRVDEKHPLKVFIQLEGECNGVFVTNKSSKGFDVKELQGGKSDVPFTWQIVASRADVVMPDGSVIPFSDARFTDFGNGVSSIGGEQPDTVQIKATLKAEEAAIVNKAFENLQFATGKAEIKKSSFSSLDNIATLLKSHPEWSLKLSGHTDDAGTAAANQDLSEKRSEAVKQYLETKGVDGKRISATGYGQTKPLTANNTKADKEKNRRVEMEMFSRP